MADTEHEHNHEEDKALKQEQSTEAQENMDTHEEEGNDEVQR